MRRAWYASLARDQDQLDQYMRRLDNPPAPFGDMRRADGHRTGWRRETVFFFLSISLSSSLFFLSFGLLLVFFLFRFLYRFVFPLLASMLSLFVFYEDNTSLTVLLHRLFLIFFPCFLINSGCLLNADVCNSDGVFNTVR